MYTLKTFTLLLLICSANNMLAQKKDSIDEAKIFSKVEVEASYPGGQDGWTKYLYRNLKSNLPEKNGAPVGEYTAIVKFVISKDGSLNDIKAETKEGYGAEEEVIRVIEKSGTWIPAQQNGKPVNAYRRQPITFRVLNEDFDVSTAIPYTLLIDADNIINIKAHKVKAEDLQVTISKGKIKQTAEGKFVARVTTAGRVTVELYDTKKEKAIGSVSFVVKK